jgi:hypothetical protein
METTTYQVMDNRSVEAHVYSVRQDNAVFKVTVAEIADAGLEESAVTDHAIKTMSEGGEVKVNIPHRINRVYGRQLSIVGRDGIRSMVALFDYNGRVYQIEGQVLPAGNDASADAIRFVQSLIFMAAVLTAPRRKFELPRQLAADQVGLKARQSRVVAAVLKYAAVASNRSSRW